MPATATMPLNVLSKNSVPTTTPVVNSPTSLPSPAAATPRAWPMVLSEMMATASDRPDFRRFHSATRPVTCVVPSVANAPSARRNAGMASAAPRLPDSTSLFSSRVVRPNSLASSGSTPGSASPSCWRNSSMPTVPLLAIWLKASSARLACSVPSPRLPAATATASNVPSISCVDRPVCRADDANLAYDPAKASNDWPERCATTRKNSICRLASSALPVTVVSTRRTWSSAMIDSVAGRAAMATVPIAADSAPNRLIAPVSEVFKRSNVPGSAWICDASLRSWSSLTVAAPVARARSCALIAPARNCRSMSETARSTARASCSMASSDRTPTVPNAELSTSAADCVSRTSRAVAAREASAARSCASSACA